MVEEVCGADKFHCSSGECVNGVWYCDGRQVSVGVCVLPLYCMYVDLYILTRMDGCVVGM